jgi:hypothetical protein
MNALELLRVIASCPEGNGTPVLPKDVIEILYAFEGLTRAAMLARDTLPPCPQRDKLSAALARVYGGGQ